MADLPDLPNLHALACMLITVVALFMFAKDRWPLEITSLSLLVLLASGFALFPYGYFDPTDLFAGFANEALIAVCALMVLGQGLVRTGALEPVGRMLAKLWGKAPFLSLLATLVVGAFLSAFVNNTPIVVLLLPILISVCLRNKALRTTLQQSKRGAHHKRGSPYVERYLPGPNRLLVLLRQSPSYLLA